MTLLLWPVMLYTSGNVIAGHGGKGAVAFQGVKRMLELRVDSVLYS